MSVQLHLKRERSWIGMIVPIRIYFDNQLVYSINNGESAVVTLPDYPGMLRFEMAGSNYSFQPICAEAFIDPSRSDSGKIMCTLKIKSSFLKFLFGGLTAKLGQLIPDIQYL